MEMAQAANDVVQGECVQKTFQDFIESGYIGIALDRPLSSRSGATYLPVKAVKTQTRWGEISKYQYKSESGRFVWLTLLRRGDGFRLFEYHQEAEPITSYEDSSLKNESDQFHFSADIMKGGVLALSFATKDFKGGPGKSELINTKAMLINIVSHYSPHITKIMGHWKATNDWGTFSDNMTTFNAITGRSIQKPPSDSTIQEAAQNTWTGQLAKSLGYETVEVPDSTRRVLETDTPGQYKDITILFKKKE